MLPKRLPFFYGWVILGISFISLMLEWGARSSFSVFYVAILKEFGWSRASTALIYSFFIFNYGLISPISGALIDKFGPRKMISIGAVVLALGILTCSRATQVWHLYILWGFVTSAGISLSAYVPHSVVVSKWFVKRRGMALGVISSGTGLGSLLSLFVQQMIESFGWRSAYVIMGGSVLLVIVPLAILFQRSSPQGMGLLPDGEGRVESAAIKERSNKNGCPILGKREGTFPGQTLRVAMKSLPFWALFSCQFFFNGITIGFLLAHQVALVVDIGYSPMFGALIFSIYGVSQAIGQSFGFISDRIGRERTYTFACMISCVAVLCIFSVRDTLHPQFLYLYGILMGLGTGLMLPTITGAAADLFQGRHFGSIYGFITFGFGIGAGMISWFGGYIFDTVGGYKIVFILIMLSLCVACASIWIAAPRKAHR